MKKRLLSVILAGAMVFSLAACAGSGGADKKEGKDSKSAEGETVLKIPTFLCGENVGGRYFGEFVNRFNEKYAGKYKVELEEVVEASYTEKIKQLAQSGDLPVLVHDVQKEFRDSILIPNKLYYPVNDFMSEHPDIEKWCLPAYLKSAKLENGDIPAIPGMHTCFVGLFINEALYKPKKNIGEMSMDEFIKSLNENDKFAFQTVNNAWTSGLFLTAILANQKGGVELLHEYEGKKLYNYDQQCFKDAVAIFLDVWKKHALNNSLGADYPDAINAFTSNSAAFISNGSWMNPQLEVGDAKNWSNGFDGEKVSAYAFPGNIVIDASAGSEYGRWYMTNSGTEKEREAALAFLEMTYSQPELEQWLLYEGGAIPRMDYSEEYTKELSKNKLLSEQSNTLCGDVTMVCHLMSIMPDSIANTTFGNLLTQLVNDDITVDQFCEQMTLKANEAKAE